MPITKNSFFSNSFLIFITRFFPSLANLAVLIGYSRYLPPAVYGTYQDFWIQLNVLYPIACFGIHVFMVTYSPGFVISLLKNISIKYYIIYAIWLLGLGALFAWLQWHTLHIAFIIPFLFFLCFSITLIFESALIIFRRFNVLVASSIFYSSAFCLVHWYVLKQGFSVQGVFTYLLALTVLKLCVYCTVAISNIKRYATNGTHNEPQDMPSIRSLWLHLGLYDVLQVLFNWVDKFAISLIFVAQVSAIYFNGSMTIPFLPLLTSAAGSAVLIQLAGSNKKDETQSAILLMNQTGKILSCIVFPVFFFLFFFRQGLIVALLSDKYIAAIPVFMVSVLVLPVRAYSFTTVLQRMHQGAVINTGAIADLLIACALMYPLYLWLGLPGVALSFVVSTYMQAAFYLIYTARLLQVSPLKLLPVVNWIVKLIVFAALFIIIRYGAGMYFTGKFTLILGGALMVAVIAVSLLLEFKNHKQYGGS